MPQTPKEVLFFQRFYDLNKKAAIQDKKVRSDL
jgi:hypothetical protein